MLNLILGIVGLVLHSFVVYYGWRMYKILNPVRYWTRAWLFFSSGNLLILIRRCMGIFDLCSPLAFNWPVFFEFVLQISVSVLLLIFVRRLNQLYGKYFTNGLNVLSWLEEQKKE